MRIGTKSVLYGAHQFLIHPWFVAIGWWKLYGFPTDYRLWVAFFVHDLGYWGKQNMDGEVGETHPIWGAELMYRWFGHDWWRLCAFHSRYWCKKLSEQPSQLCYADKLSFLLEPKWIYLVRVYLTGEWQEYIDSGNKDKYYVKPNGSIIKWYNEAYRLTTLWMKENSTWTKDRNSTSAR